MLATLNSVGLPLSLFWKGGERAVLATVDLERGGEGCFIMCVWTWKILVVSHVETGIGFWFPILDTGTGLRATMSLRLGSSCVDDDVSASGVVLLLVHDSSGFPPYLSISTTILCV